MGAYLGFIVFCTTQKLYCTKGIELKYGNRLYCSYYRNCMYFNQYFYANLEVEEKKVPT